MRNWICIGIVFLSACAAAPQLEKFPRREIDRPYTLPKGVAAWSTLGTYSISHYTDIFGDRATDRNVIALYPFVWGQSLADDWTLVWAPIPIAVLHQLRFDEKVSSALSLGYGLLISNAGYSTVGLSIGYSHRQKLNKDFALEFGPTLMPWFPIGNRARWDFQADATVGPLWQAGETFALRAGISPTLRRNPELVTVSGGTMSSPDFGIEDRWKVVTPVYFGFGWSVGRQWDLNGNFTWQKIGETQGYSRTTISYELRHYW